MFVDKRQALQVHLCGDEVVIITLDSRTGKLNLRDTGDLAAAGRGPRFSAFSDRINDNPTLLLDSLIRLRLIVGSTIFDTVCMLNAVTDNYRLRRTESKLPRSTQLSSQEYVERRSVIRDYFIHLLNTLIIQK